MHFITRPTQWTIIPEGEPIFHELATVITIEDEAAGELLKIKQHYDNPEPSTIFIEADYWPVLRQAIDAAVAGMNNPKNIQNSY